MRAHIEREWKKLGSPNNMSLVLAKASWPWFRNPKTAEFAAAARATVRAHGVEPCLTREGGSIPIVGVFEEECDATCVLLPIGASDDGAHSQNEKLDRSNYLNGVKTLGCYVDELGAAGKGGGGDDETAMSREAARSWRRQCKKDLNVYGCDCCL